MATARVSHLVNRARIVLQETTDPGVRWPVLELQDWLNDAYREIILLRPDANSESEWFACSSGTRQWLTGPASTFSCGDYGVPASTGFPHALRLLDVVQNQHNRAIRLINRAVLDDQRRAWHSEQETTYIEHFMFDPRLPREFLVYPPASECARIEVVFSSVPVAHDLTESQLIDLSTAETIKLPDSYSNAILDYILYRAFTKDAEYAANLERALMHYQAFQNSLGVKTQANTVTDPKRTLKTPESLPQ